MTVCKWLVVALWLVFFAFWIVAAMRARRAGIVRVQPKEVWLRLAVVALVVLALRVPVLRQVVRYAQAHATGSSTAMCLIGVVLCVIGIGLAVAARGYLGRNWAMPMSRQSDTELVTTGPYALVRHPIYTGVILAMLGSTFAVSLAWLVPSVLFGVYFIYSARREERYMMGRFPERYPAYMKRTKMLLPFVL